MINNSNVDLFILKQYLDKKYPLYLASSWDYCGLVAGDINSDIKKVCLCVDVTYDVLQYAILNCVDLIIAHHPLLFKGIQSVSNDNFRGDIITLLYKHKISCYVAHTSADCATNGVADSFASELGIKNAEPLIPSNENEHLGLGRVGSINKPITLYKLALKVASIVGESVGGVLVSGSKDNMIQKIALLPGSGDSIFDTVRSFDDDKLPDCYITSDLRHHPALDFIEKNKFENRLFNRKITNLINIPHNIAESVWLKNLQTMLTEAFTGLDVEMIKYSTEPWSFRV